MDDAEGEADDHAGGEATGYSERRLWMFCVSAIYAVLLFFGGVTDVLEHKPDCQRCGEYALFGKPLL